MSLLEEVDQQLGQSDADMVVLHSLALELERALQGQDPEQMLSKLGLVDQ